MPCVRYARCAGLGRLVASFLSQRTKKINCMAKRGKAGKARSSLKHRKKPLKPHLKSKVKNKPKKPFKLPKPPLKSVKSEKPSKAVSKPAPASAPAKAMPALDRVQDTVNRIKCMQVQGANDVAEAGVRALKHVIESSPATNRKDFIDDLREAGERLKSSRPTEPALRNAINRITNSVDRYELRKMDNVHRYASRQADLMLKELADVVNTISDIGSEEINDGDIVMTHCHSEHVVAILKRAKEKRRQFRVIVTETRPMMQGMATARELSEAGIDTTYIIDSAIASFMKQATKVLLGCDAILADGSIVNKIGTYTIALVAKQFQTPVFVAAETLKFDPITVMGAAEPIEQRSPDEITNPQDMKGVHILNPAFDVTPAELVSALITEKGVMRPELIRESAVGMV